MIKFKRNIPLIFLAVFIYSLLNANNQFSILTDIKSSTNYYQLENLYSSHDLLSDLGVNYSVNNFDYSLSLGSAWSYDVHNVVPQPINKLTKPDNIYSELSATYNVLNKSSFSFGIISQIEISRQKWYDFAYVLQSSFAASHSSSYITYPIVLDNSYVAIDDNEDDDYSANNERRQYPAEGPGGLFLSDSNLKTIASSYFKLVPKLFVGIRPSYTINNISVFLKYGLDITYLPDSKYIDIHDPHFDPINKIFPMKSRDDSLIKFSDNLKIGMQYYFK